MGMPVEGELRASTLASIARPLFMNNLITALAALNRRGEERRLEEAFHHLSRLFYYIDGEELLVSLGEERDFLTHYLELQRLRFEERLSYSLAVDEELLDASVPRFCLFSAVEPIVERRIEDSPEPGKLFIECRPLDGRGLVAELRLERGGEP